MEIAIEAKAATRISVKQYDFLFPNDSYRNAVAIDNSLFA
jgi:hypothetical protein